MNSEFESSSTKPKRIVKQPAKALEMDRGSSSSGPPTPAALYQGDPIADQEYAAFGLEAEDNPLPAPPKNAKTEATLQLEQGGVAAVGAAAAAAQAGAGGPRTTLRAAAITGPIGRAKRPKNVKYR